MNKICIAALVASIPLCVSADENGDADCGVGANVMNPIKLEQSQLADFGKIPSSKLERYVLLTPDGKVRQGTEDNFFPTALATVGSKAGKFTYSGTEGFAARITKGAFASCNQGTHGDLAVVVRDMIDGEKYVRYGFLDWRPEFDGASGDFEVGVLMGIDAGFVGKIDCTYELAATYL